MVVTNKVYLKSMNQNCLATLRAKNQNTQDNPRTFKWFTSSLYRKGPDSRLGYKVLGSYVPIRILGDWF